jgi:hypothetical protein
MSRLDDQDRGKVASGAKPLDQQLLGDRPQTSIVRMGLGVKPQ